MPDAKVITSLPVILERLHEKHPNARYELDWTTPVDLLVATILAAQCTDERVNQVTKTLFKKYPDARAYAEANMEELEQDLKPTGFYRQKAKTVQAVCQALVEKHDGEVPVTMEEMVELPGVARKTANVVLNNAFQLPTGVIVDTHVQRVSGRMGLTDQTKPEKIEIDLMKLVPQEEWIFFGPAMVLHGRYTCTHHAPKCDTCPMNDLCPRLGVGKEDEDEPAEEQAPPMAAKKTKPKAKAAPTTTTNGATHAVSVKEKLPADWQKILSAEFDKPYFKQLEKFLKEERSNNKVFPPEEDVFNAFRETPFEQVKVVLLGQDPYHGEDEAHGMCFSVKPGVKVPPSLVNVYKELQEDLGCKPVPHGYLVSWARQGVLLLNTVLTVRANEAGSHKEQGWEPFTDAVIKAFNDRKTPVVFLLWGSQAHKKADLIDTRRHRVLKTGHPSPLSAKKFFGSKPFSQANAALQALGQGAINWQLPADPNGTAPQREQPTPVAANRQVAVAAPKETVVAPKPVVSVAAPPTIFKAEKTHLETLVPAAWRKALAEEFTKPYFQNLDKFLAGERKDTTVYPAEADLFAALRHTPPEGVRVVLLGTEPSCSEDVADGLAYSVREGVELSETVQTMFRELRRDLGCRVPVTGSLEAWARQGVLLLNTILTVRSGRPGSHKDKGWDQFTSAILSVVNASARPTVFALWGDAAQKKRGLVDQTRHVVVEAEHPGTDPDEFEGSGVFSEINTALELRGRSAIYWQLQYV